MENYDILNKSRCQEILTPTSSPSIFLHNHSSSLFQHLYNNERRYRYISYLPRHAIRPVLTHTDAMAESFRCNNDFIPCCFHVKSEERKSNFSRTCFPVNVFLEMLHPLRAFLP